MAFGSNGGRITEPTGVASAAPSTPPPPDGREPVTDLFTKREVAKLLGVSETSSDMRDLLDCETKDVRAAEAVALFCYQAKKWIGSFAAALGGLDTLVFAGGIGENAPEIRRRICESLGFLGISLDEGRNASSASLISTDHGPVTVRDIRLRDARLFDSCLIPLTLATMAQAQYLQGKCIIDPSYLVSHILLSQYASGTPSTGPLSIFLLVLQINSQCTPSVLLLPTGRRMQRHLSSCAYTRYVDRGP